VELFCLPMEAHIPPEEDRLLFAVRATTIKSYGEEQGYNDEFTKFGKRCYGHSLRQL
jgi:hypothetical protein